MVGSRAQGEGVGFKRWSESNWRRREREMVVSQKKGTSIEIPKYDHPYYRDFEKGLTPQFGKPPVCPKGRAAHSKKIALTPACSLALLVVQGRNKHVHYGQAQEAHYPLIREYTLNYSRHFNIV